MIYPKWGSISITRNRSRLINDCGGENVNNNNTVLRKRVATLHSGSNTPRQPGQNERATYPKMKTDSIKAAREQLHTRTRAKTSARVNFFVSKRASASE